MGQGTKETQVLRMGWGSGVGVLPMLETQKQFLSFVAAAAAIAVWSSCYC